MPRLTNPPLVHVLAQVVHTPVLALDQYIADIQEKFLRVGYPYFSTKEIKSLVVDASGNDAPRVTTSARWDFINRERNYAVTLTQNAIVIASHCYDRYETFDSEVARTLQILHEYLGPTVVQRTGLRYFDFVQTKNNMPLSAYLKPGILAFDFAGIAVTSEGPVRFRTETVATTNVGDLAVRCYTLPDGQQLTPEISIAGPLGPPRANTVSSDGALGVGLDFDHVSTRAYDFGEAEVRAVLQELQIILASAFRNSVTGHALSEWA